MTSANDISMFIRYRIFKDNNYHYLQILQKNIVFLGDASVAAILAKGWGGGGERNNNISAWTVVTNMRYLDLATAVDNSPYVDAPDIYIFLSHDGVVLGKIVASVVVQLKSVPWIIINSEEKLVQIRDPTDLDANFAVLTTKWREANTFKCLKGWRDELYTCYTTTGTKYFSIERSAACLFGIVTYGCHITGFVPSKHQIWVPRRSATKQTYPNQLDNTVAGGLGNDVGFWECAVKECGEEAGLSPGYVARHLRSVGVLTYEFLDPETGYFQPEVECVYDLNMDDGTIPKPTDGEVAEFNLMGYDEVQQRLLAGEFKYNCALVLIDFFIRHGVMTPENEKHYFELVQHSHRKLEYPLR